MSAAGRFGPTHEDPGPETPAAGPLVLCRGVGHTFGTGATAVVAVQDVNCEIVPGARIALMGPSGSGKSTLLHMIAGLEQPTSGMISGQALVPGPVGRPDLVGIVFQGTSLIPALDVLENVALPLIFSGTPDAQARRSARHALEVLDIAELQHKLPEELSGGQSQRVAAARVLAAKPRLILADEPTGQLDHATGMHLIGILLRAAESLGAALLVSTHDPLIAGLLGELWLMRDGTVSKAPERRQK